MMETTDPADPKALLEWYRAAGVDMAMSDEPVDRFAASQAAPRPKAPVAVPVANPTAPAASPPAPPPLVADAAEARALAASAETLDQLRALLDAYDGCALKFRATQLCFADGNPQAEIMLVGEGPGAEEDRVGRPFVGKAGQLLDRMLGAIGLDRTRVYIANVVPWRPPGNREPTPQEINAVQPFLMRQIALVNPKILVTVGAISTRTLFNTTTGITRMRGQWRDLNLDGVAVRALPMLHPAYLLRQPAAKRQAWADMLALKTRMDELGLGVASGADAD